MQDKGENLKVVHRISLMPYYILYQITICNITQYAPNLLSNH